MATVEPIPQQLPRLSILLTEGSSLSSRQALYALGPRHTIDILDPSPLCQSRFSRYVRRRYAAPSFSKDPCAYLASLGDLLRKNKYDVLLPTHEEIYLLSRVRDALSCHVALAVPEFSVVQRLQSKLQFHELLQELGLPHPETTVVTDRAALDSWTEFPRFVKTEWSTAGQGTRLIYDRSELQQALQTFERHGLWHEGAPLLLQRLAVGKQAVARAVFRHGALVGYHMNVSRLRGVGGSAVARESCLHPPVVDHLALFGQTLNWHGPLFLDYFYDDATHTPAYIEADPRIGDVANATLSGANLCEQWVNVALDRAAPPATAYEPGIRSHAGFLVLMSRALDGANRRELCGELKRQFQHREFYEHSQDEMTRVAEDWLSMIPYAWVASRLLLRPGSADKMVRNTVANYALSPDAAQRIRDTPVEVLNACFEGAAPNAATR